MMEDAEGGMVDGIDCLFKISLEGCQGTSRQEYVWSTTDDNA